jgi:peptidoglycan-N-acetylglucosamine deacetylase
MKLKTFRKLSPFHISGIISCIVALILFYIYPVLAVIPVVLFILVSLIMPFIIWSGFFVPVIFRGRTNKKTVAITFDDGPDRRITPAVLKLLSEYSVKAVFFVTGKNASENPDIIKEILKKGHSIGNHSYNHDPLLMLRPKGRLYNDIKTTQDVLAGFGIRPLVFRPPAGITNPRLRSVLLKLNLYCINWSVRAFDGGNRNIRNLSGKLLRKVKPNDIILLHDIDPGAVNIKKLTVEFELLIKGLIDSGLSIVPLSEIIEKDIMMEVSPFFT